MKTTCCSGFSRILVGSPCRASSHQSTSEFYGWLSSVNPDPSHVQISCFCILKKLHGHESWVIDANLGFKINLAGAGKVQQHARIDGGMACPAPTKPDRKAICLIGNVHYDLHQWYHLCSFLYIYIYIHLSCIKLYNKMIEKCLTV